MKTQNKIFVFFVILVLFGSLNMSFATEENETDAVATDIQLDTMDTIQNREDNTIFENDNKNISKKTGNFKIKEKKDAVFNYTSIEQNGTKSIVDYYNNIVDVHAGMPVTISGQLVDFTDLCLKNATVKMKIIDDYLTTTTNKKGIYKFEYTPVYMGEYQVELTYDGNKTYNSDNIAIRLNVIDTRESVKVSIGVSDLVGLNKNENVECYDYNENLPYIIVEYDGKKTKHTLINNAVNFNITPTHIGTNKIIVTYPGDDKLQAYLDVREFEVTNKTILYMGIPTIRANIIALNDTTMLTGYIFEKDTEGNLIFDKTSNVKIRAVLNDKEYSAFTDEEGNYKIELKGEQLGYNNVYIYVDETDKYICNEWDREEFLVKEHLEKTVLKIKKIGQPYEKIFYGENILVRGILTTTNGTPLSNKQFTDENGIFVVDYFCYDNNISVCFFPDDTYAFSEDSVIVDLYYKTYLTVDEIADVKLGDNITISGSLTIEYDLNHNIPVGNKTIFIDIENHTYNTTTDENGNYKLEYTPKYGNSDVYVYFEGDGEYISCDTSTYLTILDSREKVDFYMMGLDEYQKLGNKIEVNLYDEYGNLPYVIVQFEGKSRKYKFADAPVTFNITSTKLGKNTLLIYYPGDKNLQAKFRQIKWDVINKTIVNLDCQLEYHEISLNDSTLLTGKLMDMDKNPIAHQKIRIENDHDYKDYFVFTDTNGEFKIEIKATKLGRTDLYICLDETEEYFYPSNYNQLQLYGEEHIEKVVLKIDEVYGENEKICTGDEITIKGTLTTINGTPIQNKIINCYIMGVDDIITDENGKFIVNFEFISNGEIYFSFWGDDCYTSYHTSVYVEGLMNTSLSCDKISNISLGKNIIITGILRDYWQNPISNESITIQIENKNYTVFTDDGKYYLKYTPKTAGYKTIKIHYQGNSIYNENLTEVSFSVKKPAIIKILKIKDVEFTKNAVIRGKVVNMEGKALKKINLRISVGNKSVAVKTDNNGIFSYNYTTDRVGVNKVTITYAGNSKYQESSNTTSFTVTKRPVIFNLDKVNDVEFTKDAVISGCVVNTDGKILKNTDLNISVGKNSAIVKTDNKGMFTYNYTTDKVGKVKVTIVYAGNGRYQKTTVSTVVNVVKRPVIVTFARINNVQYSDNVTVKAKFENSDGQRLKNIDVQIKINNETFTTKTDKNGFVIFTCKTTKVGKTNVTLIYSGNSRYQTTSSIYTFNVVKKDTKITINKIKEVKSTGNAVITGTFTNSDGLILKNVPLTLTINNKNVTVKTNSEGVFSYTYKTSTVGVNNVTVSYAGNSRYAKSSSTSTFKVVKA